MSKSYIYMPCVYCQSDVEVAKGSPEHEGVFNVFCDNDGLCEDKMAFLEKTGKRPEYCHEYKPDGSIEI